MAREIFINYSRRDKEIVFPFVQYINEVIGQKNCCWIDLKGIESGGDFEDVIMQAIDDCKIVPLGYRSMFKSLILKKK